MDEATPRRPSIAFAVALWVLLTVLLLSMAALAITYGFRSSRVVSLLSVVAGLIFLLMLWGALTGWIVRQRWPRSRLARLLPETIHGHPADRPAPRPVLTIALVLAAAIAVVAWQLLRRR